MKKVLFVLFVALSLMLTSCCKPLNYKYEIRTGYQLYYTNEITYLDVVGGGGCIMFLDRDPKDNASTKVCGTYTIEENPEYKPELNNSKNRRK